MALQSFTLHILDYYIVKHCNQQKIGTSPMEPVLGWKKLPDLTWNFIQVDPLDQVLKENHALILVYLNISFICIL